MRRFSDFIRLNNTVDCLTLTFLHEKTTAAAIKGVLAFKKPSTFRVLEVLNATLHPQSTLDSQNEDDSASETARILCGRHPRDRYCKNRSGAIGKTYLRAERDRPQSLCSGGADPRG